MDVSNTIGAAGTGSQPVPGGATSMPGQLQTTDFLRLMVAQLQYQDPLQPANDTTQLLTQLSQFTMVQEIVNLSDKVAKVQEDLQTLKWQQALNLVGMEVTGQNQDGGLLQGVVTGVRMVDGNLRLLLGDKEISLSQLLEVRQAALPESGPDADVSDTLGPEGTP